MNTFRWGNPAGAVSLPSSIGDLLGLRGGKPVVTAVLKDPSKLRPAARSGARRDALLDAGALAETLETAAFWDRLPANYTAVREARNPAPVGTPSLLE